MNKKRLVALAVASMALSMTACSTLDSLVGKGAEVNDNLVDGSIKGLCFVYSVGSIKREFNTPEKIALYNELCESEISGSLGID